MRVLIRPHARKRYRERGGAGELTYGMVYPGLRWTLLREDDTGCTVVRVVLPGGLSAICVWGGEDEWVVTTVLSKEMAMHA